MELAATQGAGPDFSRYRLGGDGSMDLEARVLIDGRTHEVRDFVYYFPECVLVVKTRRFQGERVRDIKRLEFQLRVAPGDWRAIQVKGVRWE